MTACGREKQNITACGREKQNVTECVCEKKWKKSINPCIPGL